MVLLNFKLIKLILAMLVAVAAAGIIPVLRDGNYPVAFIENQLNSHSGAVYYVYPDVPPQFKLPVDREMQYVRSIAESQQIDNPNQQPPDEPTVTIDNDVPTETGDNDSEKKNGAYWGF